MSPQEHCIPRCREIADCAYQVCRPDPGSGKEHHHVHLVVRFHLLHCRSRFFLRSDDHFMFHQLETGTSESFLCAFYDGMVNERNSHWISESILVHSVDNESGGWL